MKKSNSFGKDSGTMSDSSSSINDNIKRAKNLFKHLMIQIHDKLGDSYKSKFKKSRGYTLDMIQ